MAAPDELHWIVTNDRHYAAVAYTSRLLSSLLGRRAVVVTASEAPEQSDRPTIYYGRPTDRRNGSALWVLPAQGFWNALDTSGDVTPRRAAEWRGTVFPCWNDGTALPAGGENPEGCCPVDPIAAAFFLVSRAEEHLAGVRDQHGRFRAQDTWMVRVGLSERPLVHEYARAVASAVGLHPPDAAPAAIWPDGHEFAIAFTHDIDRLRMHGPLWCEARRALSTLRFGGASSLRRRWQNRRLVRRGQAQDPYDTVDRLVDSHTAHGFGATFFWMAATPSARDSDYDCRDLPVRQQIAGLQARGFEIGLHGSYDSFQDPDALAAQRDKLAAAANAPVVTIRQHYLRFCMPETWQAQVTAGLRIDSTLGFAERLGFRAGVAIPFRPWCFRENHPLDIWEVPLVMMDGTAREYMRLTPEEALARSQAIIARIAAAGGGAALLWHNSSLNDIDWKGWESVYDGWLATTKASNGWGTTVSALVNAWQSHVRSLGND